jgi:serine/threonine protein kinase
MSAQSKSEILIFTEALRLPAEARSDYIDRACAGDENQRRKVQALLRANDRAGQFLEELPSAFAGERIQQVGAIEKPGDWIGRYKLLRQIGEGGWGVVFLAEQKEPVRRQVALKVIKPGMDTKSVIARFEAERQALALMNHPHIAHVLDAGATQTGRPFFVMELVRGIKITEYCDQNSLATRGRIELFIKVCGAIQYAHQKGIIHRDIKPSNILVDTGPDGKAFPKVIDFGIVKATTDQPLFDKTLLTGNEIMIGTPAYMSPEQAAHLDIDTRADIYSLGALLYELLTGTTPFDSRTLLGKGLDEIRRIICTEDPPRPSARLKAMSLADQRSLSRRQRADSAKLMREVRGDLDWIVMKALEKDRARRYATANGLAMDVQRYLFDETVVARPPSQLYKFRKLVLRNKLAFAGVALFTLFLVAGLTVVSAALSTERQARRLAQAEAAKSKQVTAILVESVQDIDPEVAAGQDKTMFHGILDGVSKRLDMGLTNQPEVQAQLRATIGKVYRLIGLYERAETMDRAALAIYRKLSPWDSPQTASTLGELGLALINRDALPEAERAEMESMAIRRRLFGDASLEVATSLDVLAHVYMDEGKIVEAESPIQQSLAIRRKLLDPESLEVADSLRNLTVILGDEGKWAEAEDTARKVLAIRRKCLGPENPGVASALQDLAWAVGARGKLAEAQALEREALELRAKFLPASHPEIAKSLYLLGDRLRQRGDLEDAYAVLNSALSMQQQNGDRAALFETLHSLGLTLEDQRKLSEAEAVFRRRFDLWREVSERETPRTSSEAQDLSRVLRHEGKPAEAEKVQTESLAIRRRLFGDASTEVAALLNDLAHDYLDDKKYAEAESLSRQSLAIRRKLLGPESLEVADSLRNLTIILIAEHKFHDAEEFLNQTLTPEIVRETSSADLLDLRVNILARQGRFREAATDATAVLKLQPDAHYRYHTLAPLMVITGNRSAYEKLCREMLSKFGTTKDAYVADRTAKDCLLLPNWGVDLTMVSKLADTAINAETNDPSMPFFEACKTMSEYRLGHFAEAVVWAEKPLSTTQDDLRAYVYAILAMGHWQLGEKEQAREMLAAGNRLAPPMSPIKGVNDLGDAWGNWLFARISLDEASHLLQPNQ